MDTDMTAWRVTCPECEETVTVSVPTHEYEAWKDGMLIQDAMPSLSRDDRERLMTGLCPADWNKIMYLTEQG